MNSKQRFEVTCDFGKPDRFLIDYMAHPKTDSALRAALKCTTEEELLDCLNADFYYLPGRDISQNEGYCFYYKGPALAMTATERVCPLGIRWTRGAYDAKFFVDEALAGPLRDAQTEQDILKHRWPCAADFDFAKLIPFAESHADRVIIGGLWTGIMGDSYRLHGFENFLLNIAMNPSMIHTLIDRMTEMYLELNDAYFSQLKGKLGIWFFGNDFGSQNGTLLSESMWCDFFFEPIQRLTALAHRYDLKVMMHSCGSIVSIIPHLIKAGVDILDPIQVTARDMAPDSLADAFGGKIVFHGGIDTQHVLPHGTADDVRRHVREVTGALGKKGGYIFSGSQILGSDIPVDNILAMYGR